MKLLALVILLITCSNSYGFSCMTTDDGKPLYISSREFHSEDVMEMIEKLPSKKYDDNILCRIGFSVYYKQESLFIDFTDHLRNSTLEDKHDQIYTKLDVKHSLIGILVSHYLEYACSGDKCDKDFAADYIDWLIEANYTELQEKLASFILGDDKESGQCFNGKDTTEECSSKQCVANIVPEGGEKVRLDQFCADDTDENAAGLYFMMKFDLNFEAIYLEYEFRCDYDECNEKSTVENAIKIFKEEYDPESVLKRFGYKSEDGGEEQETTFSTTEPLISSSSQPKTNSIKSTSVPTWITTSVTTSATTMVTASVSTTARTTVTTSATTTVQSTSITNSYINKTVTTIGGTTIKANNGMHLQSTNAIIYATLITFMSRLAFLG